MASRTVSTQTTGPAEEISSARFVWIKLHREILTHRFRNRIAVLASLNAPLRDHLDLRASVIPGLGGFPRTEGRRTNLFWNQI